MPFEDLDEERFRALNHLGEEELQRGDCGVTLHNFAQFTGSTTAARRISAKED